MNDTKKCFIYLRDGHVRMWRSRENISKMRKKLKMNYLQNLNGEAANILQIVGKKKIVTKGGIEHKYLIIIIMNLF